MAEAFPNPPITEALIEIRAQLPASITMRDLESLHAQIKTEYPDKKTRTRFEARLEIKDEKDPLKSSEFQEDGYLFTSPDGKQVAQFRLDGFTFNRLRPYSRWEDVYREAKRTWEIYGSAVRPVLITLIAVRYINSIEIPSKHFDYEDFSRPSRGFPRACRKFFSTFSLG